MVQQLEEVACLFGHAAPAEFLFERPDWWLGTPGRFAWWRCPKCELRFLSPRPPLTVIADYYPPQYAAYRPAIDDERWALMRWKRQRNRRPQVRAITRRVPQPGTILDVGCATGDFLVEMRKLDWHCHGVEIQAGASAYARERFNLDVFTGDLLASPFSEKQFDVVTLWDVLEHTHTPLTILQKARILLKENGLLAFSIPAIHSVDAELFGRYWIGYDAPRHLYVFGGETLLLLLIEAGFSLTGYEYFLGTFHTWAASFQTWLNARRWPSGLRNGLSRIIHIPILSPLTSPYFWWLNRRQRGSVVTVLARADR